MCMLDMWLVDLKTRRLSIEELDSSDATGVKNGLESGLQNIGLGFESVSNASDDTTPTLVCANFDGANVMQGLKTGTMAKILADAPWVVPMHCVAHKLELAALDTMKSASYMAAFERTVKVRWLASRTRALKSLIHNLPVIITHFEHAASRGSSEEAAKAKGILRELKSVKFVMMLHAMSDIFTITSSLSQIFQEVDLLVTEVYQQVDIHATRLEELKHENGPRMKEFLSEFDSETSTYRGIHLTGNQPSTNTFFIDVIDGLMDHINKRFSCFNSPPITLFSCLDYKLVPKQRVQLVRHGKDDLAALLDHFNAIFPRATHNEILQQYTEVKVLMRDVPTIQLPSPCCVSADPVVHYPPARNQPPHLGDVSYQSLHCRV